MTRQRKNPRLDPDPKKTIDLLLGLAIIFSAAAMAAYILSCLWVAVYG